jgi:hypothetical protein
MVVGLALRESNRRGISPGTAVRSRRSNCREESEGTLSPCVARYGISPGTAGRSRRSSGKEESGGALSSFVARPSRVRCTDREGSVLAVRPRREMLSRRVQQNKGRRE